MTLPWKAIFIVSIAFLFLGSPIIAQPLSPTVDSVLARDGKMLAVDIHKPGPGKYPVILIQTPYNRQLFRFGLPMGIGTDLASSNYIFVVMDWRGFYGSGPPAIVNNTQRGQDGYDAVQWIASQSWSNGKVATWGPSALGRVQYLTAREDPPNLVCAAPLVAGMQFSYEEYFPGGVYRTEYVEQLDGLGFGMSTLLLANPTYNGTWAFVENENWYPDQINVPMFLIAGWYDHNVDVMIETFNGLRTSSDPSVRDEHRIVIGPWVHGGNGTAYVGSETQGELSYPDAAGWSDSLALAFFDRYMRNKKNGWYGNSTIRFFQMGEDRWAGTDTWPPAGATSEVDYYFSPNTLSTTFPTDPDDSAYYDYDPRDPSPTIGGTTLRADLDQGPYDQTALVESRSDILVFTSPVLVDSVEVRGKPRVELSISSDQWDTDFAVRITDVYPDSRSMLLSDGIFRMRFRNGFTTEDSITPGVIYPVTIELPHLAHTFMPGHQIRVDVTSSNYPKYDKNLNNNDEMYVSGDTNVARNVVYFNATNASKLVLPEYILTAHHEDVFTQASFSVFPNPFQNELVLTDLDDWKKGTTITVYNMTGDLVYAGKLSGALSQKLNLATTAGLYVIRLTNRQKTAVRKIVKY